MNFRFKKIVFTLFIGVSFSTNAFASAALTNAINSMGAIMAKGNAAELFQLSRLGLTIENGNASISNGIHKLQVAEDKLLQAVIKDNNELESHYLKVKEALVYRPAKSTCIQQSTASHSRQSETLARQSRVISQGQQAVRNTKTSYVTREVANQLVKSNQKYCLKCDLPMANINADTIFTSNDSENGAYVLTSEEAEAADDFIKILTNPIPDQQNKGNLPYTLIQSARSARISVSQRALNSIKSRRLQGTESSSFLKAIKARVDLQNSRKYMLSVQSPPSVANELRHALALKNQLNFLIFEELEEINTLLATLIAHEVNPLTKAEAMREL